MQPAATPMTPSVLERSLVWYARRFPLRRGKLRIVDSLWALANGDRATQRIATLKHGGLRMSCDLSQLLQRQFYFFGTYFLEEPILECWTRQARGARMVFDIGANAGIYSLAALAAQPNAMVHAFEPTPEIAARLRDSAALNRLNGLHVHPVAISAQDGQLALIRYRGDDGSNDGMNFVVSAASDPAAERVTAVALDRFCADQGIERVDLVKLDIQGNEPAALAGAAQLLADGRIGMLFLELNWGPTGAGVCPAAESIRLLEQAGYQFSAPCGELHWRRSGDWMRALTDVVACRGAPGGHS